MDTLSREERSKRMSRIKGKDTKPEMRVRRMVHALGYRYRLHRRDLPGCPDLVFPGRGKVIFVSGCFWHRHEGCHLARLPKSREEFWKTKLEKNRERDLRNQEALERDGWGVLVIWECETKQDASLSRRIIAFLDGEDS
ncbi:very short patch repair endonuclease [Fodinicurvata sediminis]|uniref:very short patch repair endonuclease n=1 Tax=Fodinicurvata sediminis TaxID=1121832 RepID=UPI0003B62C96|nr:very short patch repair endonuclease [Fodinicurvata sediminis]